MNRLICNFATCFALALTGCANIGHQKNTTGSTPSPPSSQRLVAVETDVTPRAVAGDSESSPVPTVAFQEEKKGSQDEKGNSPKREAEPIEMRSADSPPPVAIASAPASASASARIEALSETANSYTLADIEQMALGNNPAISAAQATTGVSSGLYRQVGTRPNPVLGYFGQQLADRNTDQHGVFIEQEFVRGDKLALNQKVLGHTNRAQQLEVETQRYRVLTDVRVRFFEAVAAQKRYEATQEFQEVARRGVTVAKERQKGEEGTLVETLQAQTLFSEVSLAAEQAEVAYRGAWRDLAAIAGLPLESPLRLTQDFTNQFESPDLELAYAEIISQSPELAVAHAIVREKQAILQRQQVQAIPNITGQFGVGQDRATNHGIMNLQISMPLPVYNKNCGNISAARHDYVRATHEVQRIKQSIRSRLARTLQDFDTALAAVRKYEDEIIPQAKESLALSEKAYRVGELEFLQVLVLRRGFYNSSVRLIQAKGQLAQATAKMDGLLLTGGLEAPQNHTDGDGLRGASLGGL